MLALLLYVCAFGLSVSSAAVPEPRWVKTPFNWAKTRDLLVFGDSYSFVQGTAGYANYSFIGDAFDFSFTPKQLLTDEIIPKNTSSDGSNWVEFLTDCYGGLPAKCYPHSLWDFSFAGADITVDILPLHHNFSVDLVDQVKQWAQYASNVLKLPLSTLVAWWIGINDTGDSVHFTNITDWTAYWEAEMVPFFDAVETVYSKGLRNFLFINVPPEERSPAYVIGNPSAANLSDHIVLYNRVMAQSVDSFASAHPDTNVFQFDAHTWFNDVLDNHEQYGFKNITGYCTCTDPTYFWYNTGHPTEHVHRLLAASLEQKLNEWSML